MRRTGEDGAAVALSVGLVGVLLAVALGAAVAASLVDGHRRAQASADLAALAGAQALQRGEDGCPAAERIAVRNRTRLVSCDVAGAELTVVVAVDPGKQLPGIGPLPARARAGP